MYITGWIYKKKTKQTIYHHTNDAKKYLRNCRNYQSTKIKQDHFLLNTNLIIPLQNERRRRHIIIPKYYDAQKLSSNKALLKVFEVTIGGQFAPIKENSYQNIDNLHDDTNSYCIKQLKKMLGSEGKTNRWSTTRPPV